MKKNQFSAKEKTKRTIKFFCENIKSNDYQKFVKLKTEQNEIFHKEYIEKEKPNLKSKTDYYNGKVYEVIICDTLSNYGISKLVKKLYNLPKKKYTVKNFYKKPTLFSKYDYIHLQYSSTGSGTFAKIEFLKDNFINNVEIVWSQVNNYFALLEYHINFKKVLKDEDVINFTLENVKQFTSKDFKVYYNIGDDQKDNFECLMQMENELFQLSCQHIITSLFYSEYGKSHKLINLICCTREEEINTDTLYLSESSISYQNKKNKFIITSNDYESCNFELISGGKFAPCFSICRYISNYGNDFYYKFFGYRELRIFEYEFSRYSSGRKKITYNKKLVDLLNRLQSLTDEAPTRKDEFDKYFKRNWKIFIGNKETKYKSVDEIPYFRKIYNKNFSYFKLLTELNYTRSNKRISWLAIIVSIISIIISFILAA